MAHPYSVDVSKHSSGTILTLRPRRRIHGDDLSSVQSRVLHVFLLTTFCTSLLLIGLHFLSAFCPDSRGHRKCKEKENSSQCISESKPWVFYHQETKPAFLAHFPSLLYLNHQLHFEVDIFQPMFPSIPAHSYEEVWVNAMLPQLPSLYIGRAWWLSLRRCHLSRVLSDD